MKKRILFIVFFSSLILFFFSLSKITFLFGLFQFALTSDANYEKKSEILAKTFIKNNRLYSFVKEKYLKDEAFLTFFAMEMIKQGRTEEPKNQEISLFTLIEKKYPENIFLDKLNLYRGKNALKDWQNIDLLSFKILESSKFNGLSFNLLIKSIYNKKISEETLIYLIHYLSWKNNFVLADDLLKWGIKENKIAIAKYKFLIEDLISRKNKERVKTSNCTIDKARKGNGVKKVLNKGNTDVYLWRNLIKDGCFANKTSLKKYWRFADMSDEAPFPKGSFYGDFDSYDNSMRIMGFFNIKAGGEPRAGFWYKEQIHLIQKVYLFTFRYKTFFEKERPSFWLSDVFNKDFWLETTNSTWRTVCYIFNNKYFMLSEIRPLLRMWGTGTVLFDDICLFEIESNANFIEKEIFYIK